MTPEDFLLNGNCDDCDQDPANCCLLGKCLLYKDEEE